VIAKCSERGNCRQTLLRDALIPPITTTDEPDKNPPEPSHLISSSAGSPALAEGPVGALFRKLSEHKALA
jgi:hypothetical protein